MIFNDLKDVQDARYPEAEALQAMDGVEAAVLCNMNFVRPLLGEARARRIPVVTDVHTIDDPEDPYNREFLAGADTVFVSNEHFAGREKEFAGELIRRYGFGLLIIGMGAEGALLYRRDADRWHHSPAPRLREVVNTIGAGDALSASFVDGWLRGLGPEAALDRACVFAAWKVGARGAAEGFLTAAELEQTLARRR
ncbi:MAG: carbohydrate kinase family protein [Anaeromyxobacter sp.]